LRLSIETARDHSGDLDIEASDARRVRGIGFDERGATLGVTAPAER